MTDFAPGPIITRDNPLWDGDRPSWLRDGVLLRPAGFKTSYGPPEVWNWSAVKGFALDASDIVYRCIAWNEAHPNEPPMWPWYGGDEAPADWAGDRVLNRCGGILRAGEGEFSWAHPHLRGVARQKLGGDIIGYQRRPTTSLPEPAEDTQLRASVAAAVDREIRSKHGIDPVVPAYSAVATAKHYAELAGGVFVPFMTEGEALALWMKSDHRVSAFKRCSEVLCALGIIRPDPTPIDIAKAELPHVSAKDIERIAAIVKGEMK